MEAAGRTALICLLGAITVYPPGRALAQAPASGIELTSHAATVGGTVLGGDEKPAAAARVRLRDAATGRIVMVTQADQTGQFRFAGVPSGSYLVELIDDAGNVRGLSQTFTVAPGSTFSTVIRVTARKAWYRGFFSNAALAAVSSAAALGVTALSNGTQPASGRF